MERLWKRFTALLPRHKKRTGHVHVVERFAHFRAIGAANDAFLHHLASLQEGIDLSTVLGMTVPDSTIEALSASVRSMVKSLNEMTGGRYGTLLERYETLDQEINLEVLGARPFDSGPLVIWPTDADALRPEVVGPKAARLAEIALHTGMEVPPFFSISLYSYRLFMDASGLQDLVKKTLGSSDFSNSRAMRTISDAIATAIAETPIPRALESEMLSAYRKLVASHPGVKGVAVRSSTTVEDAESSFAGQFESILNVHEAGLDTAYKRVIASKYRHEALKYTLARGVLDEDIAMPVLVMAMVQPSSSGVAYSRCPQQPESTMITAVRGLAQAAVDGKVIPDMFLVSAQAPTRVEEMSLGNRTFSLRCAAGGGLQEVNEEISSTPSPALDEEAACNVARAARALELHFGSPQDVEWALDEAGSLMVIQTRPLYLPSGWTAPRNTAPRVEGYRILLQGAARASNGVASGPVFHLSDPQAFETVPEGAILCVPTTSPRLAGMMGTVRGVIAAAGSPTGHMATVAREFSVPCLVGAENAPSVLQQGMVVTVDADAGVVYEGEVQELLCSKSQAGAPSRKLDRRQERSQRLLRRVAPLTLTEPDADAFCPNNCQTLHDIARYVHQKSMVEMFELEELSAQERRAARRLFWRAPLEVLLLDLGGGLDTGADRIVPIDKVKSIPLLALIEGMTDPRLRWSGPVGFDLRGFMSVVVRSAADDQRYGEPNYCLCSKDYVNFATRLAYHFATVDSICGQMVNENYARFLFYGGAAVAARREWRAHFLSTVLKFNGFAVTQVGDRVEALLTKRNAEHIEEVLVMLGRLMVASRHLDMVIESQAAADALAQAFLSGDYGFERIKKVGK